MGGSARPRFGRFWLAKPQKTVSFGWICAAAVLLGGCATTKEPGIEIREVLVPTPVACIRAEQIPAEPEKVGSQLSGDARHDLSVVAESALELRKWGQQLNALIAGCTE